MSSVPTAVPAPHDIATPSESSGVLAILHDWLVTVDHKRLGIMYVVTGLVFLVIGGIEASLMRLQLAWPGLTVVPAETFNRLFTLHGTTMVFLVGIPIVFGFGNYLVPLMIGARDLAFPRLNAFGFWVLLFGGALLYFSFIGGDGLYGAGSAPAVGWFAYAPLSERAFTPGNATDYWNLSILITGFGTNARSDSGAYANRSEEHTSELQSHSELVCRLLPEKKKAPSAAPCGSSRRTSPPPTNRPTAAQLDSRRMDLGLAGLVALVRGRTQGLGRAVATALAH